MNGGTGRFRRLRISVALALLIFFMAAGTAKAQERRVGGAAPTGREKKRMIALSVRIAEAKNNRAAAKYFKSLARQQKKGKITSLSPGRR